MSAVLKEEAASLASVAGQVRPLHPLLAQFEALSGAPHGVTRLRELILSLALQGKVVAQDKTDEPAEEILKRICSEKINSTARGRSNFTRSATLETTNLLTNLPPGWAWTNLATIGLINPRNDAPDDLPASFVQMSSIPTDFSGQHVSETRSWRDIKTGFTHFSEGDVGIAKITPCFENAKSTVFSNLVNGIGAGTTELHIVRPLGGICARYVLLFLKSSVFLREGEAVMTGSAGQKRLPRSYFENKPFPLPPLAEQNRIVARVDELMRLCDALEEKGRLEAEQHARLLSALLGALTDSSTPDELAESWERVAEHFDLLLDRPEAVEALQQTILRLAVRGLLVSQNSVDEPAACCLQAIRAEQDKSSSNKKNTRLVPSISDDEAPFKLPSGWVWARAAEIVEMLNGYAFKSEWFKPSGIRLVRNINVSHGSLDWSLPACIDEEQAKEFTQFKLNAGDVVLSLDRPIISSGLKYAVIKAGDLPCLLLQRVARLIPNKRAISPEYLLLWLQSDQFQAAIDPGRSNGVPHISTKQVGALIIGLPPINEQVRIVARVKHLQTLCANLHQRLVRQRTTQDHLADSLVEQAI